MKNTHKLISATQMKNRFGDYLGEVVRSNRPVLVERHGKPSAVLISFEEWENLQEKREAKTYSWSKAVESLAARIAKNHPNAEKFSAVELIHQIRSEELGKED